MTKHSKRLIQSVVIAGWVCVVLALGGCELTDPTEVHNPSITDESLRESASGGTVPVIVALRRQMAVAQNSDHILDLVSDNCVNTLSYYSNALDNPASIVKLDFTLPTIYNGYQTLQAIANFGLTTIIPADDLADADQIAEVKFYRGMAVVLLAENFSHFPIKEDGPVLTAREAVVFAIADFNEALAGTTNSDMADNCRFALARAYRLAGDKANAQTAATTALAAKADYLMVSIYTAADVVNAGYGRTTSGQDLKPLPRLDFLDPKFTTNISSIPVMKGEEAHLILAEVALSNNDLAGAKTNMKNAIALAKSRTMLSYRDTREVRGSRPNDTSFTVKADASSPAIAGLVKRHGSAGLAYTMSEVSNTSVTAAMVDALVSREDHIRTLYLLRQEIFFLEGRRMSDLGIRLPVSDRQFNTNTRFVEGGPGTVVVVPSYIPLGGAELDRYSVAGTVVTCTWDMNRLIAQNIAQVSPFTF